MKGKYLITTNDWFYAPDGNQYRAAWGDVQIVDDSILGIKTNRNSVNWFAKVGSEEKHVIIAGCQIHYALRSEEVPSLEGTLDWNMDATSYNERRTPNRIYVAQ